VDFYHCHIGSSFSQGCEAVARVGSYLLHTVWGGFRFVNASALALHRGCEPGKAAGSATSHA